MSDDERTPLGTARINSGRFNTELAAVWYAANFYYEASIRKRAEYSGLVFQEEKKFGITVRYENSACEVHINDDVPRGTKLIAIWHTHLPNSIPCEKDPSLLDVILGALVSPTDFSKKDTGASNKFSARLGRPIPIYLATATVIKRYRRGHEDKTWSKEPPKRLQPYAGRLP